MRAGSALALGLLASSLVACARALPPPGGEEDPFPPAITGTEPAPLAVVPDFQGPVVFRFDERISERNTEDVIMVSPATGEVRVDRGRSELRVALEGGWRPGQVYRIVLLPGVRDLFGNERGAPAELVFSTGPDIPETAFAGVAIDRITGRPARNVFVRAFQRRDSVEYSTAADSAAFFTFQHLPVGAYEVRAFVDQNGNRRLDANESASHTRQIVFQTPHDTLVFELAVVPADTTPPRVTRADARDSLQVLVTVDDYLEPDAPLEFIEVSLLQLPDSTPVAGTPLVMATDSFMAYRRALGDTMPPPVRDTVAAAPPRLGQRVPADTVPRPEREFVVVPAAPLPPRTSFVLRVSGLTNISGVTGGGGEVEFTTAAPPTQAPDTTVLGGNRRLRR